MTKPIKNLLNDWEVVEDKGCQVVKGVSPDGDHWTTSPIVHLRAPGRGLMVGWVETKNSIYALGTPKAK